jgi:hypothetical protein
MYRKDAFATDAVIGMVKSTNHRFRNGDNISETGGAIDGEKTHQQSE